jgi:hypothetical protein
MSWIVLGAPSRSFISTPILDPAGNNSSGKIGNGYGTVPLNRLALRMKPELR